MEFSVIAEAVHGFRNMTPEQGRRIYDHIRATRPSEILELGTSYGVSAAYMAAALEANGHGRVTTVDHVRSNSPSELVKHIDAAVARRIEFVRISDSSYNWWLSEQVAARSDRHGNVEGLYDLCYLDGAHNWTVDGLAVILIEKLLEPGGWVLLDDYNWTYRSDPHGLRERGVFFPLSAAERAEPHVRRVFELIVKPHPAFGEFHVENEQWVWARKSAEPARRLTVHTSESLPAMGARVLLKAMQYLAVSVMLQRERLLKARRDPDAVQREIEERAQELARERWVEQGYDCRRDIPSGANGA
jgi:predicted O-methyltransferase YrrM